MKKIALSVTIILIMILASACQANTSSTHAVYLFNNLRGPDHQIYHPGDQWTLNFQRGRSQDSSETTPTHITLTAQLIGPFSSPPRAMMRGPVAVSLPPINTNDWTTLSYTRVFHLPKSLAPGYYDFVQTVSYQGSNGASSTFEGASNIHIVSLSSQNRSHGPPAQSGPPAHVQHLRKTHILALLLFAEGEKKAYRHGRGSHACTRLQTGKRPAISAAMTMCRNNQNGSNQHHPPVARSCT